MKPLTRFALLLLPLTLTLLVWGAVKGGTSPFFAMATASAGAPQAKPPRTERKSADWVELEVRDVVPIEELGTHAVMLVTKGEDAVLPLFVSEEAAISIAFRLAERKPPHPLTADLLDSVLKTLGGQVMEIRIDDIRDESFTGHMLIRQGDKQLSVAARPSDAIAVALGEGQQTRIFATRKVMQEGGLSKEELRALGESGPGVGGSGPPGPQAPGAPSPPLLTPRSPTAEPGIKL